jgi:hypothetical protein
MSKKWFHRLKEEKREYSSETLTRDDLVDFALEITQEGISQKTIDLFLNRMRTTPPVRLLINLKNFMTVLAETNVSKGEDGLSISERSAFNEIMEANLSKKAIAIAGCLLNLREREDLVTTFDVMFTIARWTGAYVEKE